MTASRGKRPRMRNQKTEFHHFPDSSVHRKLSPAQWDTRSMIQLHPPYPEDTGTVCRINAQPLRGKQKPARFPDSAVHCAIPSEKRFLPHILYPSGAKAFARASSIRGPAGDISKERRPLPSCRSISGIIRRRQLSWGITIAFFYFLSIGKRNLFDPIIDSQR